ncbi:GNAT family N-acetyltransferase [Pseudoclavibacter chungangensis]|uniref:GNAT family N-acetyltransferase n=1 Tax=Pseudoclavibacter chungangensis TaxID=587635 RepID=A0A7J5C1J3_9MICO|nr:GNAT family N-acetyltransferase [Pseudoclavibacter chungangensis]KAB1659612.1 GNAT family N-acetyltransferase [Pseudoclavibacter chungangensis]NYJ67435.1 GNAT superfamily N-acetyltransferase [Pseudoclavibacter chungangensis]
MNDVAPGIPLTIVEVPPPTFRSRAAAAESIDGGPRLIELLAEAENALRRGEYGAAALQTDAAEVSALWALATHWRRRSVIALSGDAVVGLATVRVPLRESLDSARIRIGVASNAREHGIGGALIDVAERIAREEGRTRLRLRAPHVAGVPFDPSAGWIESPDGVGRVPAAAASSRFLTHHGWSLAGVERVSALDLQSGAASQTEALDAQIAAALAAIEPEYALHVWSGPTPPEWLGGVANLSADLPGDAPTGHAAAGESSWDVNRVASNDVRIAAANRTALVVGVEHVPTGTLVAFSELHLWRDHPNRPALQGLTIVHPEHRGRRLGLLTKARLVRELRERAPECPGIVTWSPESDARLVSLGERLGFRPIGVEGVWTKTLEPLPEEPETDEAAVTDAATAADVAAVTDEPAAAGTPTATD